MHAAPVTAFAPGRLNLIGEHTDYNDGFALPFALHQGVTVEAVGADRAEVRVKALDLGEQDSFPVDAPAPSPDWRAFVRGAVAELRSEGVAITGASLSISGTVPRGAGLGSSAALEVSTCLALLALAGVPAPAPIVLAGICQRIEHRWVGARTGLLDQLASLGAESGQALLIDFRSLETEPIPVNLGAHQLVLLDSGQRRQNADSVYNLRRDECQEAAHRIGKESLRDAQIQDLHLLPDVLARRARHVVSENGRVQQAASALRTANMEKLGRLLDASHKSLRDDYEVSSHALEQAVSALRAAGALGARMVGGGSGGHALGLMPPGCQIPAGARPVSPGPGARLI